MTTHAPPKRFAERSAPPASDQVTEILTPLPEALIVDAGSLLDSRSRARLVAPRMARRGPHLAIQDGDDTRLLPLRDRITHFGRGTTADVRIEQHHVSRDHAIIVRHGRYARLLDNRSANGTFLNGLRIMATNLADGDVVRFGPVIVQYVEVD